MFCTAMSTETTSLPPIITVERIAHKEPVDTTAWTKKLGHHFITRDHPRDLYQRSYRTRPLGLIPKRKRVDVWKELGLLMSSNREKPTKQTEEFQEVSILDNPQRNLPLDPVISAVITDNNSSSFRYPSKPVDEITVDDEYLNTLAQCNIHHYNNDERTEDQITSVFSPRQFALTNNGEKKSARIKFPTKPSSCGSHLEYLSFSWQAQLNKRLLFTDTRDPLEREPCERCRLRGTRCSKCMAIRTGGGYIILDGLASDSEIIRHQKRKEWQYRRERSALHSGSGRHRRKRFDSGELGQPSFHGELGRVDENGGGFGGLRSNSRRGTSGRWDGRGGGWEGGGGLGAHGSDGLKQEFDSEYDDSNNYKEFKGSASGDGLNQKRLLYEGNERGNLDFTDTGNSRSSRKSEHQEGSDVNGSDDDDHRKSGAHIGSSRPHSSLQRNGSAKPGDREGQHQNSLKGQERGKRNVLEKQTIKGRRKDGSKDSGDEDEEGTKGGVSKRKRRPNGQDFTDGTDKEHDRQKLSLHGQIGERKEEDNKKERNIGDLMKFKSKRDNVKVKECTLKELQGIDPLDYLAKYCIIDQEKVPHYRQVFDNVDRDEDDELTIPELDFALKAVNYNLISDNEMQYVYSVLELAGRYALNFQLFSLVAALSEKVVSLEDMVKRMINTMDFEALETKMKKCKELFYLLANDKEGVVTTRALSVELQAGGLTEEHVDFVTDRLNHEGKGVVEFLDYLTYVPLFVEIHDNINDNPLDFTRNR